MAEPDSAWLGAAARVGGRVPTHAEVVATRRGGRWAPTLPPRRRLLPPRPRPTVVSGRVLVDVTQTVQTDLVTGIQRVALETVRSWARERDVTPVVWDGGHLRTLRDEEWARLGVARRPAPPTPVLPWRATVLLPEVPDDPERIDRLDGLARHAECTTGMIGFDCVPLTSPETVRDGFLPLFHRYLGFAARVDRVAAISAAAAEEFAGWRESLALAGLPGPDVEVVELPTTALAWSPRPEVERAALARLAPGGEPLVLVVGSHEPRKNHVTVLHAAELVWQRGGRFALAFVGGNAWASDDFDAWSRRLRERGRPLQVVSRLPDDLLAAAYRAARFTVFPSLNEGFGLPVAESLAAGTPVITSDVGSMRQIGTRGGAVLVDPRAPAALAEAILLLVTDDEEVRRRRALTGAATRGTWSTYADDVWRYLVQRGDPRQG